jgi:hypothetical protein
MSRCVLRWEAGAFSRFQPRGCVMSIQWTESIDDLDWDELAALYRAAPLGDKEPADLRLVFANSLFRCFAFRTETGCRRPGSRTAATAPTCATSPCCRAIRARVLGGASCRGSSSGQGAQEDHFVRRAGREGLYRALDSAHAHGDGDFRGPVGRLRARLFVRDLMLLTNAERGRSAMARSAENSDFRLGSGSTGRPSLPLPEARASGPLHDNVISGRKVAEKDPQLPVAHARPTTHFVPSSDSRARLWLRIPILRQSWPFFRSDRIPALRGASRN